MPRLALLALLALMLLAGCGLVGGEDEPVESDSALKDLSGLDELKARFNEDAGMIRILILLSPSCPECRLGASRVQQKVLDENPDADLRVYVVWADVIINDNRPSVDPGVMPDPRALHYWDGEAAVGTWLGAAGPVLEALERPKRLGHILPVRTRRDLGRYAGAAAGLGLPAGPEDRGADRGHSPNPAQIAESSPIEPAPGHVRPGAPL